MIKNFIGHDYPAIHTNGKNIILMSTCKKLEIKKLFNFFPNNFIIRRNRYNIFYLFRIEDTK